MTGLDYQILELLKLYVREIELSSKLLTIILDPNTERRVHLSLILDALDVNYLRVRDATELLPVIEEIGRPVVLILGASLEQDQLEFISNSLSRGDIWVYSLLVGAAGQSLSPLVSAGMSLVIEGQGTKQEIASAMEVAKNQLPLDIDSEKISDYQWKIAGECQQIKIAKEQIRLVAPTDVSVMLGGESGTGKELAAQAIHELSPRAKGPFIPVNCGAIPKELIESELFGHEKGAFSGAVAKRLGKFEQANGGTLFLDEVGDMPLDMQVKLLRVLQERCIERVGGNSSIPIDVRIVAATHRNLVQRVVEGEFREDLYYRLNVFPIDMPALRERRDDIPLICRTLIKQFAKVHGEPIRFSRAAQESLCRLDWPGNIRELRNLIERLHVLYPGKEVDRDALPPEYRNKKAQPQAEVESSATIEMGLAADIPARKTEPSVETLNTRGVRNGRKEVEELLEGFGEVSMPVDLKQRVREIERVYLEEALQQSDGVVAKAANLLGMQRTTLVEKMKKLEVGRA